MQNDPNPNPRLHEEFTICQCNDQGAGQFHLEGCSLFVTPPPSLASNGFSPEMVAAHNLSEGFAILDGLSDSAKQWLRSTCAAVANGEGYINNCAAVDECVAHGLMEWRGIDLRILPDAWSAFGQSN